MDTPTTAPVTVEQPEPPQPATIVTRHEKGRYVASINGVDKATHPYSEHGAAKFAAGPGFWVKEVNAHVFRIVPK